MPNFLQNILRRDAHPIVQFIKYGVAGGIATVVDLSITYFLSWKVIPALTSDDVVVRVLGLGIIPIEEALRARNYFINRTIAFLIANFVAYVTNVLWVFEPGRHSRAKEISLFYAVSGISFIIGTSLGTALIQCLHLTTTMALLANVVASVAINYAGRKFYIFKG
ncbi:MAG TPA: GtrA family protein [Kiritimatiellia bacterium]|jgi:putative flippase GtrA